MLVHQRVTIVINGSKVPPFRSLGRPPAVTRRAGGGTAPRLAAASDASPIGPIGGRRTRTLTTDHKRWVCGKIWGNTAQTMEQSVWFIWARVKRRYERLQLRSVITTQNMWFTVCSDRGPYVAIPLFRLCLWLKHPVGRMTFQSFDVRVRHWSSRSGLVFLGSCKMACRQVYMR